jgi:hypothetical protein
VLDSRSRHPPAWLFWVLAAAVGTVAGGGVGGVRSARSACCGQPAQAPLHGAATLGLVVAVMVDPIAGVGGYVAAHAIEYFAVVHRSLRTRTDTAPVATAHSLQRAVAPCGVSSPTSPLVALFVWFTFGVARRQGVRVRDPVLFGALHILYDGFVWKLRRPQVAASLGIT